MEKIILTYILESPGPQDLCDNRTEGSSLLKSLDLFKIPYLYKLVVNKKIFFNSLNSKIIEQKFLDILLANHSRYGNNKEEKELVLVLHFSSHGDENGLSLTNQESIKWEELRDLIKPINDFISKHGQLIICMSSCKGFNAMKMQNGFDIPFTLLLGSTKNILHNFRINKILFNLNEINGIIFFCIMIVKGDMPCLTLREMKRLQR